MNYELYDTEANVLDKKIPQIAISPPSHRLFLLQTFYICKG